jgi:hypothetical protein
VRLGIRKGRFTSHVNGMTSDGQNSVAAIVIPFGHYKNLEYITKEGKIIKNLNKGEFYKYLGINQSNHIQHSIIKENLETQFYFSNFDI